MEDLVRFSITMEADLLGRFDALVARRGTKVNRSEAVRDLVRDALVENAVEDPEAEIAGTITMVFDHHASDLADKLNVIQHHYIHEIVSTVHVHLDARYCLEVIVLRGANAQIRAIADTLLGTKGVKHGKLVTTTTGEEVAPTGGHGDGQEDSHRHSVGHSSSFAHAHSYTHSHASSSSTSHSHSHSPAQGQEKS
jgi:CopG family transcriptional regulator, nickel-responsive regulator